MWYIVEIKEKNVKHSKEYRDFYGWGESNSK